MKTNNVYVADFETTVYDGQKSTEVWASAIVKLGSEKVNIFSSIDETYEFLKSLNSDLVIYYHNLKFDGSFWLDFLLKLGYKQWYEVINEDTVHWNDTRKMPNGYISYMISDLGQWYTLTFKVNNHTIQLRDSLKLLPFSVKRIGDSFGTKHRKLSIEYTGYRKAHGTITDDEKQYIANDVLVIKEAIELMYAEGHKKMTIGSCCYAEFKSEFKLKHKGKHDFTEYFPNLYTYDLLTWDDHDYGSDNAGSYIRKSYKGGWCYLVKGKENKPFKNGTTADVNSLYPSMMSSESSNRYPVGIPVFWHGDMIPEIAKKEDFYFFIRVKTRFYVKDGFLPFIQIKGSWLYKGTEALETSDVKDRSGVYHKQYTDIDGEIKPAIVELTLTQTDYYLMLEHYDLKDFEILDGCYFKTEVGLFDEYMTKYKKIKQNNKGAKRELAKLFLNNLYGKMATSTDSSFKYAFIKEDGTLGFKNVIEYEKKPGYIPIGSAITSYARNFTIRAAQLNYHGLNKPGFIYADTDSIHCDLPPEDIKGIQVHPTQFCCWKLESCWDYGLFTRQKTYIEHVTHEDCVPIENPYYNIKCAGLPNKCKNIFLHSVLQDYDIDKNENNYSERELEYIKDKKELSDFKPGLKIVGKLMPKRISGGIILQDTDYVMR